MIGDSNLSYADTWPQPLDRYADYFNLTRGSTVDFLRGLLARQGCTVHFVPTKYLEFDRHTCTAITGYLGRRTAPGAVLLVAGQNDADWRSRYDHSPGRATKFTGMVRAQIHWLVRTADAAPFPQTFAAALPFDDPSGHFTDAYQQLVQVLRSSLLYFCRCYDIAVADPIFMADAYHLRRHSRRALAVRIAQVESHLRDTVAGQPTPRLPEVPNPRSHATSVMILYTKEWRLAPMAEAIAESIDLQTTDTHILPWSGWHGAWEEWHALQHWLEASATPRVVVVCFGAEQVRSTLARSTRDPQQARDTAHTDLTKAYETLLEALLRYRHIDILIRPVHIADLDEPTEAELACQTALEAAAHAAQTTRRTCGRTRAGRVGIVATRDKVAHPALANLSAAALEFAARTGQAVPETWDQRWRRQGKEVAAHLFLSRTPSGNIGSSPTHSAPPASRWCGTPLTWILASLWERR